MRVLHPPEHLLLSWGNRMNYQPDTISELRDEVIAASVELFEGDQEAAEAWLQMPLKAIDYAIPMIYMDSEARALEVRDIIGRLEHGVWT